MKSKILILLMCLFCVTVMRASAQEDDQRVVDGAKEWLLLVDTQQYEESYLRGAQYFKKVVTQEQWVQVMSAVRKPLGDVLSREIISQTHVTELPGAPDGEYVVILFNASFENKQQAVETMTQMLEEDGIWRMAGYYIN